MREDLEEYFCVYMATGLCKKNLQKLKEISIMWFIYIYYRIQL